MKEELVAQITAQRLQWCTKLLHAILVEISEGCNDRGSEKDLAPKHGLATHIVQQNSSEIRCCHIAQVPSQGHCEFAFDRQLRAQLAFSLLLKLKDLKLRGCLIPDH